MLKTTILFLAANPEDTTRLRLDYELREIRECLRGARLRDRFQIEVVPSARQKDIRRSLVDHEPSFVHFSCHGTKDAEIILEKDEGGIQFVGAQALVPLLETFKNHVECVVLSSCYTVALAKEINRHVRYVVGARSTLPDNSAIQYAAGFYDGLFGDRSVEQAHQLGCSAITWAELPGHLVPLLNIAEDVTESSNTKPVVEPTPPYPDQSVWAELSRLYARPSAAWALLSKVGFPRDRMPLFSVGNAAEFWAEVGDLLMDGAVEGIGPANLLEEAVSDFPGNATLKQI